MKETMKKNRTLPAAAGRAWRLASLATLLSLLALAPAPAQSIKSGTARATLDASTGDLRLEFYTPGARVSRGNDRLTLTPVLTGAGTVATFPPIVVEGRLARTSRQRQERSGLPVQEGAAVYLDPARPHYYEATIPAQEAAAWSDVTARLALRVTSERCGCEVTPAGSEFMIVTPTGTRETRPADLTVAVVGTPAAPPVAVAPPVVAVAPPSR
jgi:hypothetical protein